MITIIYIGDPDIDVVTVAWEIIRSLLLNLPTNLLDRNGGKKEKPSRRHTHGNTKQPHLPTAHYFGGMIPAKEAPDGIVAEDASLGRIGDVLYEAEHSAAAAVDAPIANDVIDAVVDVEKDDIKGWGFSDPRLRPFVVISITYLLFTVTDGAIRMIVLLHAYNKSFSALEVAIMFTLYELAGVFTNLAAGMMGDRWGIRLTLITGLCLQVFSYGLLFGWRDGWSKETAIVYVTIAQMFAGIAKDLTKLGGKTVTKLVTPEGRDTRLFKLVSLLTGWKNSLKGVGYFLGSALLEVSYELALGFMIGLIVIALPFAIFGLSKDLGTAKKKSASLREIFVFDNYNLNVLSLARLFLFASRDFWFEVPVSARECHSCVTHGEYPFAERSRLIFAIVTSSRSTSEVQTVMRWDPIFPARWTTTLVRVVPFAIHP